METKTDIDVVAAKLELERLRSIAGTLQNEIEGLFERQAKVLREELALRQSIYNRVEVKKNNMSTTLLYNGRSFNIKRNAYNELVLREKGRVLATVRSVNEARWLIATGDAEISY